LQSQVFQGQLNGLLVLLIVVSWWADRRDNQLLAGACIGSAAAIKLFPAFLLLYWLMQKRWRALIAGIATFSFLNGVAWAVLGNEALATYLNVVIPSVSHYRSSWNNRSLSGFWLRLFDPEDFERVTPWIRAPQLANILVWTSQAGVTALAAICCRQARARLQRDRALGLSVVAMLLVTPVTWEHYLILLLMPLSVEGVVPRDRAARLAFYCSLGALWVPLGWFLIIPMSPNAAIIWSTHRYLLPPSRPWQSLVGLSVPTYALLILFYLGWRSFRDSAGSDLEPKSNAVKQN
jgi:hypothetical protein